MLRPIRILYRDESVVVVDKPCGLLVHPGPEAPDRDTCLSRLRRQLGHYVYPCHRLDRGTSGALLLAFSPDHARRLFEDFAQRRIDKTYLAVVRGYQGHSDLRKVDHPVEGQPAVSRVRELERFTMPFVVGRYPSARYSLVEVHPETGRTHQIRRHLKHLFHPIVGDKRYGDNLHNRWLEQLLGWRRMALAATRIAFPHPQDGRRIEVECPAALMFEALIERLRILSEAR